MPFTGLDIVYGLAIPCLVAALVTELATRTLPTSAAKGVAGTAFVAGFLAGYWLLTLGPVVPRAHWNWLPYALVATLPAGFLPDAAGQARVARYAAFAIAVGLAVWLLVPTRSNLQPSRPVLMAMMLATTLLSGYALDQTFRRAYHQMRWVSLVAIFATAALILLLSGSVRFAQIAGCGLGAAVGVTAAAYCGRREAVVTSLAFPASMFLVAAMMIGKVNSFSEIPSISYVLVAAAPISLALTDLIVSRRQTESCRQREYWCWALAATPLILCLVAMAFAAIGEFRVDSEGGGW